MKGFWNHTCSTLRTLLAARIPSSNLQSRHGSKKNTSLLFLKGRSVKKEIQDAKKSYSFEYNLYPSQSEGDGYVLKINKYKKL